jgi:1-aminocyclopropane-1-carboxylate deaminase/D-cysteine desulfhydrase-like pyridoxal-dependent ACC family enzyme
MRPRSATGDVTVARETTDRPLLELWPALKDKVRFAALAELPTPVTELTGLVAALGTSTVLFEKRDDLTSPIYGGNKVRTLEVLLAAAAAAGSTRVYATGAYGSNHAAATVLHAPRLGLDTGAIVYPQPHSRAALENLELLLSRTPRPALRDLPHWSALPFGMWQQALASRRQGERATIMVPGGAVPEGALGYVSAGLELGQQIAAGALERPATVVVPIGSNCTTAGLLVGFAAAAKKRLGFVKAGAPAPPRLLAVRVTPWPVTSWLRVVSLAARTAEWLRELTGDDVFALSKRALRAHLGISGRYLGRGYGYPSEAGLAAIGMWNEHVHHALETTYSAKAAAAVVDRVRRGADEPLLYWSTKSSVPLPRIDRALLRAAPRRMRRWMEQVRASGAP